MIVKSWGLYIIFYLITVIAYADNNVNMPEPEYALLNRGYIRFDPEHESASYIYADCFNEIFHRDFRFEKTGIRCLTISMYEGFEYDLYYVLEEKELPNILTVVYLDINGKRWGFYKKNVSLEGILLPTEMTGLKESVLGFY